MKKIKTKILLLSISLLSFSGFGQVLTFTDQQEFLDNLANTTVSLETFDDNVYEDFTVLPNEFLPFSTCSGGGILTLDSEGSIIFTFSASKNAFGVNIYDAADEGASIKITLMTGAGDEYTVVMDQEGDLSNCNNLFFGVINYNMDFTMATITRMGQGNDAIDIDNVYCAAVARPIPTLSQWGIIALSMIMLILGLVVVRQRKVIFG